MDVYRARILGDKIGVEIFAGRQPLPLGHLRRVALAPIDRPYRRSSSGTFWESPGAVICMSGGVGCGEISSLLVMSNN